MRFRRAVCIVLFFVGLTLFAFSLMPFFRYATPNFWIMTIVGMAIAILGMFGVLYRPRERVRLDSKYVKKDSLITASEREFLQTLRSVVPDRYEVVPQVALVNVIDKRTNTQYRNELFRVCDYCIVDGRTFEPILLIELNDSSHKRADRRDRDEKVAAICAQAKLPLVTFWMDGDLSAGYVKKTIARFVKR